MAASRVVVTGSSRLHAATLHKPHVGSHGKRGFVETNVTGTLTLLEEAVRAGVGSFVFTSTTSAFGRALSPASGQPAAWITEDVVPRPKNIYGATKTAAEDLCELIRAEHGLPVIVLRTSRFFPEGDDRDSVRAAYADGNVKASEFLLVTPVRLRDRARRAVGGRGPPQPAREGHRRQGLPRPADRRLHQLKAQGDAAPRIDTSRDLVHVAGRGQPRADIEKLPYPLPRLPDDDAAGYQPRMSTGQRSIT